MRAVFFLFLLLPAWAMAQSAEQSLPALYDVTDVAATDTLNVRAGPSVEFEVIGRLQPDATGIEVVDTDKSGDWGLINLGERAGWVALRYMARQPGQPEGGLPRQLACSGTEPFWSFTLDRDGGAEFSRPNAIVAFDTVQTVASENRRDRHALFADGGDVVITAMVGPTLCRDGMSDRAYGLGIDLLVTEKAGVHVYSGCCSVSR